MKRRTIKIIIIFSAVSLLGLIITQTFWVQRAVNLAERQHDHRVDMALDEVVAELKTFRENNIETRKVLADDGREIEETIFKVLDTTFLRSLINKYVDYHVLDKRYFYYIIKTGNDSVIFQSSDIMPDRNNAKLHKACLHCLWKKDYFYLAVYFPYQRSATLLEMSTWLVSSFVFLNFKKVSTIK